MRHPAAGPSIALPPVVPVDRSVFAYTRFAGFFEPYEYTDWVDQRLSWKHTCYSGDWSPLAKFHLKGADALKLYSDISVNSFSRYDTGQAPYKRDNRRIDVAHLPARPGR